MTTELKNLYENLIQEMVMDGITGMTPEIKKMITDAPVDKRRLMILNIMEENNTEHRLLCSKIQKTINSANASESKHIKDVVKMLREYVEVSDTEVKTMGEVMTPISLVEEMLDTLPDVVWTNPNLKWLDPCNGVGTFVSVIIARLMKGLVNFETDDKLRYQHIMENMIYVCELQAKNVFLYLYAFDPKDEYALNIYNGSYLDSNFDAHILDLGVEKFDIVVMNPPYQMQQEGNTKTQNLWDKFVNKVLISSLINDGYLVAVHPSGWRNVDGMFKNVQRLLKSKQILYLELHTTKDGFETFGANTTYDFYCLRNTENLGNFNTKIKCTDGKIERMDVSKMEFIPNSNIELVFSLVAKNGEEKIKVLADSSYHTQKLEQMSDVQTEEFKYPCAYTIGAKNPGFWYSNIKKEGHFVPKVIWGNGLSDVIVDAEGKYGLTQFAYAIVDNVQNLERIKQALKSERFIKDVMGYNKGVGHIYNRKVIATFRKDFWVDFL